MQDLRYVLFFFNDTATTEIYTLSLHDALPICPLGWWDRGGQRGHTALRPAHREAHRVGRDARRGTRAHAARPARAHDRRHPVVPGVSPPGDRRPGVSTGGPGRHLPRARRHASPGRRGASRADPAARRGGRTPPRGAAGPGTARTAAPPTARPPVSLAARGTPGSEIGRASWRGRG